MIQNFPRIRRLSFYRRKQNEKPQAEIVVGPSIHPKSIIWENDKKWFKNSVKVINFCVRALKKLIKVQWKSKKLIK